MSRLAGVLPTMVLILAGSAAIADDEEVPLVASLVARQTAFVPGQSAVVGLRLQHAPHWHSYWLNPGDSGIATNLVWTLPEGWSAGAIEWPKPTRFDVDGLFNFGFEGDIVLPVAITVPANAAAGPVTLSAVAKWLACKEICIPGKATVTLDLPIAASAADDPATRALFQVARARRPHDTNWISVAGTDGNDIIVTLTDTDVDIGALEAFIENRQVVAHGPPTIDRAGGHIVIRFTRSEYFSTAPDALALVLSDATTDHAWRVRVPFTDIALNP